MASSLPSSVDLPHILRVKGLAPAIVSRLEEEGFDGLSFLKASPSLLLALKFKGAEIVAIQALQNDDTFKDATVDTGFKATPENATSPVVRRSLRSNSSARNTPSPAHSRHRNSPVGSPNQFGGGRDISSTPTRDPVSLRQRIATNQLAKTVTFAERTSFALKPQKTILPSGKNFF
ncbi:uncharacterized protein LOC117648694 [Thrips palmi]|uniref:Uncharacterized protein LOC117648694 n=1 Tax=Thrips palmi TaxID=161013 RepID=A0A6P8Z9R8_THRPL|nr:uncharacterized protein LOC117648694 [Thrips palmi]